PLGPELDCQTQRPVLDDFLVEQIEDAVAPFGCGQRSGPGTTGDDPGIRLRQRGPGVGEPIELEVIGRPDALLQPIEQRLEADDSLFGDEVEGRYALEFDLGDDSEDRKSIVWERV